MAQHLNLTNSKLRTPFAAVLAVAVTLALAVALSAWHFAPALTGRLQPWVVPLALCGGVAACAAWLLLRDRPPRAAPEAECGAMEPAGWRAVAAALAAIAIVALAARTAGLLATLTLAGGVAAMGVRGCTPLRALAIGAGLAVLFCLLFVGLLRQPLPLLPAALAGFWR